MPESSSRSFPTVPTALSALTAQSMTPDAPLPHPPSLGAGALLRWLLRRAAVPVTLATLAACTSNIIQAIVPAFLGQALDAGIENGLNGRVWGIGALLLVLFVVYAVGDTMLSYFGVTAWMRTAFDVDRLVGRQISATGKDLSRQVSTGEVATIIASDADYLGKLIEHLPALLGAAASFLVVAVLMLRTSVSLGLIVILGMPLVAAIVTLVIRPCRSGRPSSARPSPRSPRSPRTRWRGCGSCGASAGRTSSPAATGTPPRSCGAAASRWPPPRPPS